MYTHLALTKLRVFTLFENLNDFCRVGIVIDNKIIPDDNTQAKIRMSKIRS